MFTPNAIADLEKRIERAYDSHSAKRVAIAALLVGVVSIGAAWGTYYFCLNVLIATGVFAASSFLTVNIAMFVVVPPTKQLAASKALMIGALKDPMRVKSVEEKKVKLAADDHHIRALSRFEQSIWDAIVGPYFIKMSAGSKTKPIEPVVTETSKVERKVLDKRQAELAARAKELLLERKKLDEERSVIETQTKALQKAQAQLEDSTSRMDASQEDLIRLRGNLQRRMSEAKNLEVSSAESALLEGKADELKAKELELESIKQQLENDRNQLAIQQATMDQIQGDGATESGDRSNLVPDLEAREQELEERLRYVADVENDLIDRLNQLCEREASVEQSEINAGVRED